MQLNKYNNYFLVVILYSSFYTLFLYSSIFTLFLYSSLFTYLEIKTNKHFTPYYQLTNQKKINLISNLFLHNTLSFYLLFGMFLILNGIIKKFIYIYLFMFFNISLLVHWRTNNNRCFLSILQNKILNIDKNFDFRVFYEIILNKYPYSLENSNKLSIPAYSLLIINILVSIKILIFIL